MLRGQFNSIIKGTISIINTPISVSLSYSWNFGSILGIVLISQILTGIFLVILYVSDSAVSFLSVEYVMREVSSGWWIRILHFNGASLFFVCLYLHIGRSLILGGFRLWNPWSTGIVLFFLVIGEAFLGYVLPWGQMSVWGACVITSLLSVLPWVGNVVVVWVWGGLVVNSATLGCFLILHYLLPLIILMVILLHILFLHESGSSTSSGANDSELNINFFPYFVFKDGINLCLFGGISWFCCSFPFSLGDCENLNEANLISSPVHIQPEWYFLFMYAILRAIPNNLGGVVGMVGSLLVLWGLCGTSWSQQSNLALSHKIICAWLFSFTLILTFLGSSPVEVPFVEISQVLTWIYFICPLLIGSTHLFSV